MAVVREKEAGTMEQLIVTPLTAGEFILGKTIPFILIAQAQMVMVIIFARLWFEIPMMGNAFVLLGASSIFLLSTLGIGLLISTVSRTQQQAMMTNFFFILPFFMLSGFVFPLANMPAVGAVAHAPEPPAPFPDHHPGGVPEGHGPRRALAGVSGAGHSRRARVHRCGQPLSETVGLEFG